LGTLRATGELFWRCGAIAFLGWIPAQEMTVELFLSRIRPTTVTPLRKTLESAIRDRSDFERYYRIVRNET